MADGIEFGVERVNDEPKQHADQLFIVGPVLLEVGNTKYQSIVYYQQMHLMLILFNLKCLKQ
jgi:hypothetical protein